MQSDFMYSIAHLADSEREISILWLYSFWKVCIQEIVG